MNQQPLTFRPPSSSPQTQTSTFQPFTPPSQAWISGSWLVHSSSLPMWKSKRNVRITYTPLDPNSSPGITSGSFDNLVESQPLKSDSVSTVKGIEKPDPSVPGAWNWRGKGWLKIASSHWEVLGWGEEEEETTTGGGKWMVIYFEKTLFTPAGVDLLVWRKEGWKGERLERIKEGMRGVEDDGVKKCVAEMFEVRHDGEEGT